ncbi:MAG: sulfur carrier protein ThiS [Spirochaetia bacterium]|nr:sulfur carrier protein ThiS [Spirochaetota bacterium]MCX8096899.1 sulfur carrier protein ThiS [Spirochaetota bacterium]MDW8112460.1 sulfur carrier protein ThiS [Spirochaetia bacterium]
MILTVNGEKREMSQSNLKEIVEALGFDTDRYVVVLNGEIVPKSKVKEVVVKEGDDIEILTIMGGG